MYSDAGTDGQTVWGRGRYDVHTPKGTTTQERGWSDTSETERVDTMTGGERDRSGLENTPPIIEHPQWRNETVVQRATYSECRVRLDILRDRKKVNSQKETMNREKLPS